MQRSIFTTLFTLFTLFTTLANSDDNTIYTVEAKRGEAIVQDSIRPIAILTSSEGKHSITIGGNINMKASYDFNGSIDSPDFIPSQIPMTDIEQSQRRFGMDATTSRIEINGNIESERLGSIRMCLNTDLRGGSVGSYTPRVRLAYITAKDFLVGRYFTAFCDLYSAAPNIDFQQANVCPYIYTTQITYSRSILQEKLTLGAAIEYEPYESSTLSTSYSYQQQYIPNAVSYLQYNWREGRDNHLRLTGLYKSIPLYNTSTEQDLILNGWGAQVSGSMGVGGCLKLYYSGTCGEGITNYIQDLYGSGLDATMVGTAGSATPQITFMYGWQASALAQVTPCTMVSAGYSVVNIEGDEARFAASDYRQGEYLFVNIFYTLTPRLQLASEYLWGSRTNNNAARNTANRFNTMIQYNF